MYGRWLLEVGTPAGTILGYQQRGNGGSQVGGGCNENGKDGTIGEIQRSRTRAGPGDCLEVGQWEEGSRLRS